MADTVLIASRKDGRTIRLDRRLADHLVAHGTHEYVTEAVELEGKIPSPRARKRTYRRRDMTADEE